jgi:hypothetical protein
MDLRDILPAMEANRASGRTELLIRGAMAMKTKVVIVAHAKEYADVIRKRLRQLRVEDYKAQMGDLARMSQEELEKLITDNEPVTVISIQSRGLQGLQGLDKMPIVFDNAVVESFLYRAIRGIKMEEKLRSVLSKVKAVLTATEQEIG